MSESASHHGHLPRLIALARGYMPSRIFLTALELDVFGQLGNDELSASHLAKKMQTDERATEILLNALVGMELLKKKGELFANVKELAGFLMPGTPDYEGGGLSHNVHLWDRWSHLTETVRTGLPRGGEWTGQKSENLALAMKQRARFGADKVARVLNCAGVRRMLDLGGGPGSYALAFVRRYPGMEAVIFDKDDRALKIAGEEIEKENLDGRVTLRKGDFLADELGGEYDLVFLSSIICICGEEQNSLLLRKVHKSLTDGGRVVIRDSILDESRTKPASAAIFGVNMLVGTPSGRSYSYAEVKSLLEQSGFRDVHRIPIDGSQLVVGRK